MLLRRLIPYSFTNSRVDAIVTEERKIILEVHYVRAISLRAKYAWFWIHGLFVGVSQCTAFHWFVLWVMMFSANPLLIS